MSATLSITEGNVYQALGTLLSTAIGCPNSSIIIGQDNRVAEPLADDFIVMTGILRTRLEMNTDSYIDPVTTAGTTQSAAPTQATVQLDIHGPSGADWTQIVITVLRSAYAAAYFDGCGFAVQTLYASDPRQVPFINGEMQYEDRWTIDAELQINAIVATPMEFAGTLAPTFHPIT